jgi:anti-anti-sigma factor
MITINHTRLNRVDLVALGGRIDSSTAPDLEKALQGIIDEGRYRIVLSMKDVTFTSSACLRAMIGALKQVKQHRGDVRLSEVTPHIKEVLELAGLDQLFKMYDNDVLAVGSF